MIVNPGVLDGDAYLLGDDNVIYRVKGVPENQQPEGLGQFFLGEDGVLYQVQGLASAGSATSTDPPLQTTNADQGNQASRFFIGDDGMLYEAVDQQKT